MQYEVTAKVVFTVHADDQRDAYGWAEGFFDDANELLADDAKWSIESALPQVNNTKE